MKEGEEALVCYKEPNDKKIKLKVKKEKGMLYYVED
jgi:hypothetical protein